AGGLPLSGVIGRAELMDRVEPGGLGGTYAGSPVACVAALAVLDVIRDENLLTRASAIRARARARLEVFAANDALIPIDAVRGQGAMIGFDVCDLGTRRPSGALAKHVCARAIEAGLILIGCGAEGETVRILAPLTASDDNIEEGL